MPAAMPFGTLWLPCVVSAITVFIASAVAHMVLKHPKAWMYVAVNHERRAFMASVDGVSE